MRTRPGIYIVPTDTWYIERTVWLIAGCVLLVGTALSALVHPWWVSLVVATAWASIAVSLTGVCLVGNILYRLGFRGRLADPASHEAGYYRMKTDRWYLERRIYTAVGINLTIASALSVWHSPWWLAFTGFVGVAMVWFAATGFCIMANGLYWMGAEPRLGSAPREARSSPEATAH